MGANSSLKGKRGERRVVNAYKDIGYGADREDAILESGKNARKRSGETGSDVNVYLNGFKLPFAVQVRDQKQPSVWVAIKDAANPADKRKHLPVAHVKRTQRKAFQKAERIVAMPEDVWLSILEALLWELGWDQTLEVFETAATTYHEDVRYRK
jgi:hypothetical protein